MNNVFIRIERSCKEHNYIAYTFSNQVLKGLTPDTYYEIELTAHNAIGFSQPTNIYLKTAKGGESDKSFDMYHYSSFNVPSCSILTSLRSRLCLVLSIFTLVL